MAKKSLLGHHTCCTLPSNNHLHSFFRYFLMFSHNLSLQSSSSKIGNFATWASLMCTSNVMVCTRYPCEHPLWQYTIFRVRKSFRLCEKLWWTLQRNVRWLLLQILVHLVPLLHHLYTNYYTILYPRRTHAHWRFWECHCWIHLPGCEAWKSTECHSFIPGIKMNTCAALQ